MKKNIFWAVALVILCHACSPSREEGAEKSAPAASSSQPYGETISAEGALPADQLPQLLAGRDSVQVKLVGTVLESCQKKGCWMKVEVPGGHPIQVTFKDYGFFVPKGMHGETAVMEGVAYVDTVSVADLRHFAEDAGKTAAEIAAITTPEPTYTLVAKGVVIK